MATALVNPKAKEFYLPDDPQLSALVDNRPVKIKGKSLTAYPHSTDVTRLARNIGHTVPAPVLVGYDWDKTNAFKSQRTTAALLTMHPRAYVLSEMGTGKSRGALYAIDWMLKQQEIRKVLIAAPLSTLEHTWGREILEHFPHLTSSVLYGDKRRRLKKLEEHADIYIINHDGVKIMLNELIAKEFDVVLIDEVATFRNKSTDRWKAMDALCKRRKYVWGMTGSPTPQAPTDAWAQVKLLTPDRVPKYFNAFKRQTMTQVGQFRWLAKPDAIDTVHSVMQPAVRFKREDVIELPPVSFQYRKVEQSKRQEDTYKKLMRQLTMMFAEGEITAVNEGVLFSKLLQIASGWVYTKTKDVVDLNPKPRLDALVDTLNEAEGKVIVFADFIHTADFVYQYLKGKKFDAELVTGATPAGQRNTIFGRFQNNITPRVIVAHPKCMAHGLTLTEANVIVWYTPTVSLETYEQACARITRPGQKRKQLIVHLTGTSVESKVYRRLKDKASVQGALLDLFTEKHTA
jgi:SNF2 family DNA or RNA helicase